jgi:DNA-binding response OmpR family regulator
MTGYEVCKQVREHATIGDTPVILLSAKGQSSEIAEGHTVGASLYMLKPYAPQQLVEEVGRLLGTG